VDFVVLANADVHTDVTSKHATTTLLISNFIFEAPLFFNSAVEPCRFHATPFEGVTRLALSFVVLN